jgi:hypothetical protein
MSIEIRITDAANESPENIRKVVAALMVLSGDVSVSAEQSVISVTNTLTETVGQVSQTTSTKTEFANVTNGTLEQEVDQILAAKADGAVPQAPAGPAIRPASEVFAHSTAVVDPSATAPVATAAPTSTEPPTAPPPPAAPPAPPVAPVAPTSASPAPAGEVDSKGVAWDKRIHSEGKTKIADGTWRMKKGVSQSVIDTVRAEQGLASATAPTAPPPPPDMSGKTVTSEGVYTAPPPPPLVKSDDTAAPASGVTPASSATPTPTDGQPLTWLQTVQRSTKGIAEKRYNQEAVGAFLKETFGVPSVGGLNGKPDELAAFNLWLDSLDAEAGA